MASERFRFRCPTCEVSTRRGLLWLGGGDWVECPTCLGTGVGEGVEYKYTPPEKKIFVPGMKPITVAKHFNPSMEFGGS